jgi:tetratricopeptide (TPR) repeat protein
MARKLKEVERDAMQLSRQERAALAERLLASSRRKKPSHDNLPGKDDHERVFIGGQYDFMPTLRAIEQIVNDIRSPEKVLYPVIPFDYCIKVEETMKRDLQILDRCAYAIFDLSDLGAQLVEMQEARQKGINSLLVYPVRERVNEPERGRRTVLSFGLSHFGYLNFNELKGIVWRFLMGVTTYKDYSPRVIYDPVLDREIRRIRFLLGERDEGGAQKIVSDLLNQAAYKEALEVWLLQALIGCRTPNNAMCEDALKKATELSKGDKDKEAEVWYYRGIIQRLQSTPNWEEAKNNLLEAEKLRPEDGRILWLLGFVLWNLDPSAQLEAAIEKTKKALEDTNMPDPIIPIEALNNLGYFLGERVKAGVNADQNLKEALELTKYLPDYHLVFRRRDATWLDTRGWVLTLQAEALSKDDRTKEEAIRMSRDALKLLGEGVVLEPTNKYVLQHLQEARNLTDKLSGVS